MQTCVAFTQMLHKICIRPQVIGQTRCFLTTAMPRHTTGWRHIGRQFPGSSTSLPIQGPFSIREVRPLLMSGQGSTRPGQGLEIDTELGSRQFHPTWLRENCRCPQCYDTSTNQRIIIPHRIPPNIQPQDYRTDDKNLHITWPDGHQSTYSLNWLAQYSYPPVPPRYPKVLWDADSIQNEDVVRVPYDGFMKNENVLGSMLINMLKYGFGIVEQVPANLAATQEVCERVCQIQPSIFGEMWEIAADGSRQDGAYTEHYLGAHSDATYHTCPWGIQIFHCLHHDGDGGETLLMDGFKCAEKLRTEVPDCFDVLTKTCIPHIYIEDGEMLDKQHNLCSLEPVLITHPATGEMEMIRWNVYKRGTSNTVPPDVLPQLYGALHKLSQHVYDPKNEMLLKLWPGTVLFVDNWRVFHGRKAFTGNRHICGTYFQHDMWLSRARTLGLL